MSNPLSRVRRGRTHRENGSSAAEYGLMITGIAALSVTLVFAFGHMTGGNLANSCDLLDGNVNGTCETEPASAPLASQN
jgi:Flp pilus assembly pilin Flp